MRILLLSWLFFIPFYSIFFCIITVPVFGQCLDDQRSMLLQLKNSLKFNTSFSTKLVKWDQSSDCSSWGGVTWGDKGQVIGLDLSDESISGGINNSSSLFSLQYLQSLNLAYNNFNSTQIPPWFNRLTNLTHLNLSNARFAGKIPIEISQMTRLVSLDFSTSSLLGPSSRKLENPEPSLKLENPNLVRLVQNLKGLKELYLDGVNISAQGNEWCPALSSLLPDLQVLSLSNCHLSGPLDSSLVKLQSLSVIHLDNNNLSVPVPEFFANFTNLTSLSLISSGLNGTFPMEIFQVTTLQTLDLSNNGLLHGYLPEFPQNASLQILVLSNTNFSGNLPDSIGNLKRLSRIELVGCNFSGAIPNSMASLTQLVNVDFSSNSFTGPIPSFSSSKNLTQLNLSHNRFNGSILSTDWEGLSTSSSFPQISTLKLASCNLRKFPDFLKNQSSLAFLDLSDNQIHGKIPNWIWKLDSLRYLNLSCNFLVNLEGPLVNLSSTLSILDLHSNKLQGQIPVLPPHAIYLDYSMNTFRSVIPADIGNNLSYTIFFSLSSNNFHGSIAESICSATYLQVLDLSNNSLRGKIPQCLTKMSGTLGVLNLRGNNLIGNISDTFPGNCSLKTLNLNGNYLEGPLPKSLASCTELEVLELGKNQINDTFPCWLKNISSFRVLVLRSNKFHGSITCQGSNYTWKMLQIVDLAFNSFSGNLPSHCFQQLYYQDSVTVTSKGLEMELVKMPTIFTLIDLSCNNFQGTIPEVVGDFKSLYFLNLSHNAFTGQIPSSLGNLQQLESLDLSCNNLSGRIPMQLTSLYFLSFLNLSFNQLEGLIPSGYQFQTFSEASFQGNKGLCGNPLKVKCRNDGGVWSSPPPFEDRHSDSGTQIKWKYISAEIGFIFGLGVVIGASCFWEEMEKMVLQAC